MKQLLLSIVILTLSHTAFSQEEICNFKFQKHTIDSEYLKQSREFWVSLPMNYNDSIQYPIIYVLDAEWRFDLVRSIEFDLSGNKKIPNHIIVGIPHVDWEYRRGIDLTFSESRMEYDGEVVDSTWYNSTNSGGAMAFYNYLTEEMMTAVNASYATNGENILIGHSYGGYFGAYLLSMNHPFKSMQLYDPAIWYSNGEVIAKVKQGTPKKTNVHVYIAYQPIPIFHRNKIKELIKILKRSNSISLTSREFKNESHNSLFMYGFLEGILSCYEEKE